MSVESVCETIIDEIKKEFENLKAMIKGNNAKATDEQNEAALKAHAANLLINHAQKLQSAQQSTDNQANSVPTPETAPKIKPEATPEATQETTPGGQDTQDTTQAQNVSQSVQGNETTTPTTPTDTTPTTSGEKQNG